ncbi:MAG: peptidoglycan DD-metalloendopeptidase family protein [Actinomycetota bacterium]
MQLQHLPERRRTRIARCVALAALVLMPAVFSGAASASSANLTSGQVADEIIRVQNEADAIAGRLAVAEQKAQDLQVEVDKAKAQLATTTAAQHHLDQQLTDIAVGRFTGATETPLIFTGNLSEQMQKDALLTVALDNGAATADNMQSVHIDLAKQQAYLEMLTQQARQNAKVLSSSKTAIEQKLQQLAVLRVQLKNTEVLRAYQTKMAQIRAQQDAAAASAAAARTAATAPAPRGSGSSGSGSSGSGPGPVSAPVVVVRPGAFVCPIAGPSAFTDTWGAPRSGGRHHEGVDMMSPYGTPLVAVVAGFAHYGPNALGGNTIWLNGADGNGYYYAHLSSYNGYSRQVHQGEVLGYVGHTGDTVANHLHFEIHPGEGPAVDPYPTVRQYC